MGEVTAFTGGQVPAALKDALGADNTDLSSGVRGGYSVISIKGSRWGIKVDGETTVVTNDDGDPVGSLKLVMLKASPNISKIYYKGGWVDGSTESPNCSSVDGVTPDPGGDVQAPSCAVCPQNVFGSRVTDDGHKAKACSDSRRMAVIPAADLKNEIYGGPMLLRIPAGSLSNLSIYGKKMKNQGFPYNTIVTRTSFDTTKSHPKIEFNAVRPLTDDEANEIVGLLSDPEFSDKIESCLAKDLEIIPQDVVPVAAPLFEESDAAKAEPAVAPAAPVAAAPVEPAVAEPKPQEKAAPMEVTDGSDDELDDELSDILGSLDNLD